MKISMETNTSIAEYFDDFIIAKTAQGLADKTLKSYKQQFKSLSHYLDVTIPIDELTKSDLDNMVASMRNTNLATNSISSYIRIK